MEQTASLIKPNSRRGERGSVLTYTVLSVLFLFLAVGLGVDLSHLYSVKTELQNAADAAALAGASALLLPREDRIETAVNRAVETLNKNKYNFNNELFADQMDVSAQRALVEFAVNLDGPYFGEADAATKDRIRFVKVQTPTVPVNVFFSIPILGLTRTMTTAATAGLSRELNVFCNYVPIAAVEGAAGGGKGWLNTDDDPNLTPNDCKPAPAPKKCDSDGKNCTGCDPATEFCAGCKYKMVAGPGDWHDTSAGNYQALDAGSGARDLKMAIAGGTTNCLTSNDSAIFETETETGRMTGPVTQGLNTRFDIYKVSDCPPGITCSNFGGEMVSINGTVKPVAEAFPPDKNIYAGPEPPTSPPGGGGGKGGGKGGGGGDPGGGGGGDPGGGGGGAGGGGTTTSWVYSGIWYFQYLDEAKKATGEFFKKPDHGDGVAGRREIMMPIINEKEFDPGKDNVKFSKVGKFFLNKMVDEGNKEIYVEFIGPALGAGGVDPVGGSSAPLVVPVLYR